ncbi:hypothetical protein MRB53_041356 [Persea americana]|nr:hypothetical protein MRB53_041356 [Persea americana]
MSKRTSPKSLIATASMISFCMQRTPRSADTLQADWACATAVNEEDLSHGRWSGLHFVFVIMMLISPHLLLYLTSACLLLRTCHGVAVRYEDVDGEILWRRQATSSVASPAPSGTSNPSTTLAMQGSAAPTPSSASNVTTGSFEVNLYASLGDSFASGPSAGDAYQSPNPCRRYKQAYGVQVAEDAALQGPNPREFAFIACSGSRTRNIYQNAGDAATETSNKPDLAQANQLNGLDPQLVTLSIGGNDVGFVNLLDHCVYRFYDIFCNGCGIFRKSCASDCQTAISQTQDNIDSPAFAEGLDSAISAILAATPRGTHLYLNYYPRFWNPDTTQCNDIQFNVGCAGLVNQGFFDVNPTILPLTQQVRRDMNALTDSLNSQIDAAVARATVPSNSIIKVVDPNPDFEGHRFCEESTKEPSYRNDNIYFYPEEFSTGGTLSYLSSFDNSTNCTDIYARTGDWGYYLACELAESVSRGPGPLSILSGLLGQPPPQILNASSSDGGANLDDGPPTPLSSGSLPDFLARIFHPTIRGMSAYRDAIIRVYQGDAAVATPSPTSTTTQVITLTVSPLPASSTAA